MSWPEAFGFPLFMMALMLGSAAIIYAERCGKSGGYQPQGDGPRPAAPTIGSGVQDRLVRPSIFMGVSSLPDAHDEFPWEAYSSPDGHFHHIGFFRTAVEAAHAHDEFAKEVYGENARLNFPRSKYDDVV